MSKILINFPVYNEEKILKKNCLKVLRFCKTHFNDEFVFVISNNASHDKTEKIAKELEKSFSEIKYFYINQKGKGIAIKKTWQKFQADYYIFMDIDLSTDLSALPQLVNNLKNQKADLVVGSRYVCGAKFERSFLRLLVSKVYNFLFKLFFNCSVKDMAIGFKGAHHKLVKNVLPLVKNLNWFFDSELVILSLKKGYKVKEIPVNWKEFGERKSRVNVFKVGLEYFKEIIKLYIRFNK